MTKNKVASAAPFLNSKPLNVNVTGTFSGLAIVNDINRRLIIFVDNSRAMGWEAKLTKNRTDIATDFACMDGGKEFGFRRTSSNDGLRFHSVGDGSSNHDESVASSRALITQVVGMGCVNDGEKFMGGSVVGVVGEVGRV